MSGKCAIGVLGAGSWGTAIAIHLASHGNHVRLWARSTEHVKEMKRAGANERYIPGVHFPELLQVTSDFDTCTSADTLIIAVPSHAFSEILSKIKSKPIHIAWLTKGIDPSHNKFLSDLIAEHWKESTKSAVISGPSFATEVAKGLPTALVIAGNDGTYLSSLQTLLHEDYLRVYISQDFIGVQLCGAVKNVLAIACGISDGMNFGANARAALITRGLAEMKRLGLALGALPETFMGLAGMGDLVLTCTDNQSRNRRFGLLVGQGESITTAEKKVGQVVEGCHNAKQIAELSALHTIDMPICKTISELLIGKITPKEALTSLMERPPKQE